MDVADLPETLPSFPVRENMGALVELPGKDPKNGNPKAILGVMIPDIMIAAQGRSNDTPTFFTAGSPFVAIGLLLVGIGAPLYVIGDNTLKDLGPPPPVQLSVKPMLSPNLYGMSLTGSF